MAPKNIKNLRILLSVPVPSPPAFSPITPPPPPPQKYRVLEPPPMSPITIISTILPPTVAVSGLGALPPASELEPFPELTNIGYHLAATEARIHHDGFGGLDPVDNETAVNLWRVCVVPVEVEFLEAAEERMKKWRAKERRRGRGGVAGGREGRRRGEGGRFA